MQQTRTRHNRTKSGTVAALHRVVEILSGLHAFVPKPDAATSVLLQTRVRHNRTQSGVSNLVQRLATTFRGLSTYMPRPEKAPLAMVQMRTTRSKAEVSGPLEEILGRFSRLGRTDDMPKAMLQSRARKTRARTGSDLLSLNSILTIVLLLAIIGFGLLLYHNNFNVEQTVNEIQNNPTQAMHAAQAEAKQLWKANAPPTMKKASCC